jgi:hypothetical protein
MLLTKVPVVNQKIKNASFKKRLYHTVLAEKPETESASMNFFCYRFSGNAMDLC